MGTKSKLKKKLQKAKDKRRAFLNVLSGVLGIEATPFVGNTELEGLILDRVRAGKQHGTPSKVFGMDSVNPAPPLKSTVNPEPIFYGEDDTLIK